jgi:bifunctional DNA-binding transcriptional regulator/antitoxin component of YhaV-PrlF toxin-antitoxin module
MDTMTFPAKVSQPLRVSIPAAVGEALELQAGALVEVTVRKIKDAPKPK